MFLSIVLFRRTNSIFGRTNKWQQRQECSQIQWIHCLESRTRLYSLSGPLYHCDGIKLLKSFLFDTFTHILIYTYLTVWSPIVQLGREIIIVFLYTKFDWRMKLKSYKPIWVTREIYYYRWSLRVLEEFLFIDNFLFTLCIIPS